MSILIGSYLLHNNNFLQNSKLLFIWKPISVPVDTRYNVPLIVFCTSTMTMEIHFECITL